MAETDRELLELAVITKAEAVQNGLKRYFTGKPCKRGHLSERFVNAGACVECARLACAAIYQRDKEKKLAKCAEYRAKNKAKISGYFKKYYEENRQRRSEAYKVYRENNAQREAERHIAYRTRNLEACKERELRYRKASSEKLRVKHLRRRARLAGAEGSHTVRDIQKLLTLQRRCCANCEGKLGRFHVDHIMPISKGGSNWPSNLQLLCPKCNLQKHAKSPERWAKEQGRLL